MVTCDVKKFIESTPMKKNPKIKEDLINIRSLEIELDKREIGTNVEFLDFGFYAKENNSEKRKRIGFSEIIIDYDDNNILIKDFFPKRNLNSDYIGNRKGIGSICYFLQLDFIMKNYSFSNNYEIFSHRLTELGKFHLKGMGLFDKFNNLECNLNQYYNKVKSYVEKRNLIKL